MGKKHKKNLTDRKLRKNKYVNDTNRSPVINLAKINPQIKAHVC